MSIRWIGAILVIVGCGGFGFSMAYHYRRDEKTLRQLLRILEFMECELEYRQSALPQLCQDAAQFGTGCVAMVFGNLATELQMQICPDASCCMDVVLKRTRGLSDEAMHILTLLGRSLGRFDLSGQLRELASVKASCNECLAQLVRHRDTRIRNYQTLGICAGVALAILLF